MKLPENIYKISVLLMLLGILTGIFSLVDELNEEKTFYVDADTKVNLTQVKEIHPRVSYYATFSSDKLAEINKLYSTTLNSAEIKNIEKFLELARKSEFYNIQIMAFMMFDDKKVKLYQSKRYIKFAKTYSVNDYLLETLKRFGLDEFQYKNLLKIKDKTFTSKEEFLKEVINYAKLKRSSWSEKNIPMLGLGEKGAKFMEHISSDTKENLINDEAIEHIAEELDIANAKYLGIK